MVKQKNQQIVLLKRLIREYLMNEIGGPAMASGTDPTSPQGFYSYELDKNDIHSFWYKSPGRGMGSDGDPGRPSDANQYIGLNPKSSPEGEGGEGISTGGDVEGGASPSPPSV